MSPFIRAIVRVFPWTLAAFGVLWGLVAAGCGVGPAWLEGVYIALLCASGMTVFVGGIWGLKLQHAGRVVGKDSLWRADRLDVGLVAYMAGTILGCSFLGVLRGGEIEAIVGGLMGWWLVSASPFSLVLIALVLGWTAGVGGVALAVHQQPLMDLWKLLLASLAVLTSAGLLRRFLVVSGPPGWLRSFTALATLVLPPLALGMFTPAHELGSKGPGRSLADTVLPFLLPLAGTLCYQWLCAAQPTREGQPAEATQGGCGCTFLGLGMVMFMLDSLGGSLLTLPLEARALVFALAGAGCAVAALWGTRRVRGRYQRLAKP